MDRFAWSSFRHHRKYRIYDGYPDVAPDMLRSRVFDGRLQLLEYVPTVLAGPPGANKDDH